MPFYIFRSSPTPKVSMPTNFFGLELHLGIWEDFGLKFFIVFKSSSSLKKGYVSFPLRQLPQCLLEELGACGHNHCIQVLVGFLPIFIKCHRGKKCKFGFILGPLKVGMWPFSFYNTSLHFTFQAILKMGMDRLQEFISKKLHEHSFLALYMKCFWIFIMLIWDLT